jgi:outer membrane lipoprotein LolB
MTLGLRFWKLAGLFFTINLVAACAVNTTARGDLEGKNAAFEAKPVIANYQGRLSLRIASDPPQSLYAGFNLNGDAQTGDLTLNSPLGNSLAQLSWTPQSAVLKANNETKEYASTSALIENATGTVIPLNALFDWMAGKNTPAEGWEIDLSAMKTPNANNEAAVQRFVAKRLSPLPTAELRIAIDK